MVAETREDGTRRAALYEAQFLSVSAILKSFYQKTRCAAAILCDSSGLVVASTGTMRSADIPVIAALAAGNYAATGELAKLIGETSGFTVHFHEGAKNNLYLADVSDDYFLVVVFGQQTTFGMIRVLTASMVPQLSEVLARKPLPGEESHDPLAEEFRAELSSRLDGLFRKDLKSD